ncbi:hypothetical protein CWC28_21720, partial [Pseudoalteromonas sp. S4492]
ALSSIVKGEFDASHDSKEVEGHSAFFNQLEGEHASEFSQDRIFDQVTASRSWQDKYRHIMLLGKKLPSLPERM